MSVGDSIWTRSVRWSVSGEGDGVSGLMSSAIFSVILGWLVVVAGWYRVFMVTE